MSFDKTAQELEVKLNLPHRAQAQHESSYRVTIDILVVVMMAVLLFCCAAVSCVCFLLIGVWLKVSQQGFVVLGFGVLVAVTVAILEISEMALPYYRINQRETFGAARWAKLADLKRYMLVRPKTRLSFTARDGWFWVLFWVLTYRLVTRHSEYEKFYATPSVAIAQYGLYHELVLRVKHLTRHVAVIGPPGSGKSCLFTSVAREWACFGAAMIYSTKYELYGHTAHYYDESYVVDLLDPAKSDRISLVSGCKDNPEFAHELAALMVGFNPNAKNGENPFWPMAATSFLKTMLLHLTHLHARPHPGMILEYLGSRKIERDNQGNILFDSLDDDLLNSPDPEVRLSWGNFRQVDTRTQTNVFISMTTMLEPFRSPHAMTVFTPPSDEERKAGVREIDMNVLRQRGKAIYVVVSHGQAARMKVILSTVFGLAAIYLRTTGHIKGAPPCLMQIDEAPNVPLHTLPEDVNVNRGLGVCFMLGYQSVPQPSLQMGHDAADTIWEGVGTKIFLPGLNGRSADFAVKAVQKTTTMQKSETDAQDDRIDNVRVSEVGRELMDADGFRTMAEHVQMVVVTGTAPAIKCRFLPNSEETDATETARRAVKIAPPPSLSGDAVAAVAAVAPPPPPAHEPPPPPQDGVKTYVIQRDRTNDINL